MVMAATTLCCTSCFRMNLGSRQLKPSENIVKKEHRLSAFSKIDLDVVARVKVVQSRGDDYRVVLRCPENYVDLFDFKVDDGELEVRLADDFRRVEMDYKDVGIVVCTPTLERLENDGTGSIEIDSLTTRTLHLDTEGVGSIKVRRLHAEALIVESDGVGNIELEGRARQVSLESNGVGSIDAARLTADDVKAVVNGVGSIECFATQRLKGDLNGVGSLKYGGHPQQKKLNDNGIGKISEM